MCTLQLFWAKPVRGARSSTEFTILQGQVPMSDAAKKTKVEHNAKCSHQIIALLSQLKTGQPLISPYIHIQPKPLRVTLWLPANKD